MKRRANRESDKFNKLNNENKKLRKSFRRVKKYLNIQYEDKYITAEYQRAFNDIKKRLLIILDQEEL